jgi:MFS family permease
VLYLAAVGLSGFEIGLLLTLTLIGDAALSLWLTTRADRWGRRRVLSLSSALVVVSGIAFAATGNFVILLVAATVGVISVSGGEVGPFMAVEQASLSHLLPDTQRTRVFGWYSLAGSFAGALGALCAGFVVQLVQSAGHSDVDGYRVVVLGYALVGLVMWLIFLALSARIEVDPTTLDVQVSRRLGLHRSRQNVLRLSGLMSIDSFGGALVSTSLMAYYFALRFDAQPEALGAIFFVANILAGLSALVAARLAQRIGLVRTMVFTHLPSNVLLVVLPFMPTLPLAALVLFAHFSLNKMDVPARQSYIVAVVDPDERSAAAGVTGLARTAGAAPAPLIAAPLIGMASLAGVVFVVAGSLKITYDVLLYALFRHLRPPEEQRLAAYLKPAADR